MALSLTVRELSIGDVVTAHGMRLLIDREPAQSSTRDDVFYTSALVLNREEVPPTVVPYSFTAQSTGYPDYAPTGEHRWTLQGNGLAFWTVVERAA